MIVISIHQLKGSTDTCIALAQFEDVYIVKRGKIVARIVGVGDQTTCLPKEALFHKLKVGAKNFEGDTVAGATH